MRINQLMNRVAIDLGLIFGVGLLIYGLMTVYVRFEVRRNVGPFLAEGTSESNALKALGDVDLGSPPWTLAVLEQKLHPHQLVSKPYESQTRTNLGWACGKEHCAINASFLVPFGQEIQPNVVPAALMVEDPRFGDERKVTVGGIHLRETVEEMKSSCRNRGYGQEFGSHRIAWDKDWTLVWGDINGKITFLVLTNNKQIQSMRTGTGIHSPTSVGTSKGTPK